MPLSTDPEARKKRLISYVFAVFVLGSTPDSPYLHIDSTQQSSAVSGHAPRSTYKVLEQVALLIAGFTLIAIAASLLPKQADAFWPFSNANAQANASAPDAATPVLAAAINLDPNPTKGLDDLQTTDGAALVAYSGPSGTVADVAGASSDRISVYVVRPGDTLSEIAAMFGVSVNTIIWANDLKGPTDVHPGDTLVILPVSGVERTVKAGDTLKSIAKAYGADADEIAQYNGLDSNAPLSVGSTIIIPGGEIAAPASSPVRPSASGAAPASSREPYLGGSGPSYPGYYESPVVGGILTQGLHGWNAADIGAARGTPIHASADGTVLVAKNNGAWNGGYGNYVVISHGNGTQTLYAHMSHSIVSAGQSVSQGQTIGYVGMTGETTGPHVHFEIRGAKNLFAATCASGERVGAFSCQ